MDSGPPLFQDCTIENLTINSITITKNTCPSHPPNTGVPPAGVGSSTPEEPTSGSPAVNGSNQAVTENRPQLVSSPRPDPSNAEIVCGNNFYQCTDTRSQLSGMFIVWYIFYCFVVTLCTYPQQGYALVCVHTYVHMYMHLIYYVNKKQAV